MRPFTVFDFRFLIDEFAAIRQSNFYQAAKIQKF